MVDINLEAEYQARVPILNLLAESLESLTKYCLGGVSHIDRISFRVKSPESFVRKAALKKYSQPLIDVEDQVAGRVLVFFSGDIEVVAERLRQIFVTIEEEKKAPDRLDAFGYESHHFAVSLPPGVAPEGWDHVEKKPSVFEIQVRTLFMHAWAEPQHDIGYKDEAFMTSSVEVRREFAHVAAMAWGGDKSFQQIFMKYGLYRGSSRS